MVALNNRPRPVINRRPLPCPQTLVVPSRPRLPSGRYGIRDFEHNFRGMGFDYRREEMYRGFERENVYSAAEANQLPQSTLLELVDYATLADTDEEHHPSFSVFVRELNQNYLEAHVELNVDYPAETICLEIICYRDHSETSIVN